MSDEKRYTVMTNADIESYFTDDEQECLGILLAKYDRCRRAEGKEPLKYIVFEHNGFWPTNVDTAYLQSEVSLMREISHEALERLEKIANSPGNYDVRSAALNAWRKLIKRIDDTPNRKPGRSHEQKDCTTCGAVGCDHKDVSNCGQGHYLWEPKQGCDPAPIPAAPAMSQDSKGEV